MEAQHTEPPVPAGPEQNTVAPAAPESKGTSTNNNTQQSRRQRQRQKQKEKKKQQKESSPLALIIENSKTRELSEQPKNDHRFWRTQPVLKPDEALDAVNEPFEVKDLAQVPKEPYPLLDQFEWCETDIDDPATLDEIYTLLTENYVEDDDCMFRFDYSKQFLQWALKPPGYRHDWHIGVRWRGKKLCAFITAVPATICVRGKDIKMVEINFLCILKSLRDKRLAPTLIKEITRRVNLTNVWQAVYTAGVVLPTPVAKCRYYHRSLNPKKLVNVGFSHLNRRLTIPRAIKLYKLPEKTQVPGIRLAAPKDIKDITTLLTDYLKTRALAPSFTEEEVAHWFLPRDDIINTFVVEDPSTHKVTDLVSFYSLPSTIIGNKTYSTLRAAYSFYNVSTVTPLTTLMNDALILAAKLGYDVFNCLDVMDNQTFLTELKFGPGDGNLQYYLFNWKCAQMESKEVGLVLM